MPARLAAVLFGALWSWYGPEYAATTFAVGLVAATVLAAVLLPRHVHAARA